MFFRIDNISEYPDLDELEEWCKENLKGAWHFGHTTMFIDDDEDAMAFKLRWI